MKICANCKRELYKKETICPYCGCESISHVCRRCKKIIYKDNQDFCYRCQAEDNQLKGLDSLFHKTSDIVDLAKLNSEHVGLYVNKENAEKVVDIVTNYSKDTYKNTINKLANTKEDLDLFREENKRKRELRRYKNKRK